MVADTSVVCRVCLNGHTLNESTGPGPLPEPMSMLVAPLPRRVEEGETSCILMLAPLRTTELWSAAMEMRFKHQSGKTTGAMEGSNLPMQIRRPAAPSALRRYEYLITPALNI